jgi:predicted nucleic acid-binding protein
VISRRKISARDALHIAVMKDRGVNRIFTFDTGFDHMPGIERLA